MARSQIAVVIVSDGCADDHSLDASGPALGDAIAQALGSKPEISYVPDNSDEIRNEVKSLVGEGFDLILTSGGTGFSSRDVTPEAVRGLLEKDAPGLVAAMLNYSLQITPMAALGRPVAGIVASTIVVTLPGSANGAIENFNAIVDVLPHALDLVRSKSSRHLHSKDLQAKPSSAVPGSSSCSHHHKHCGKHTGEGHTGPKFFGPAYRHRESPWALVPFEDAQSTVLSSATHMQSTTVSLYEALGCVVAEDVFATMDVPPYKASIVDGYAVAHTDFSENDTKVLPVAHVSFASSDTNELTSNTCARVTTGAPIPLGATAVVPVENTDAVDISDGEEVTVRIRAPRIESGDNIREIGSDLKAGALIVSRHTVLSSLGGEVGLLASQGIKDITVYRKPTVGVMSTGNEILDIRDTYKTNHVWDSNRPMLLANLSRLLGPSHVKDFGIVRDDFSELTSALRGALAEVDILITSGGVSMGELDFLKPALKALGGEIKFGRVQMKPGKPATFAVMPDQKYVLALPGNPASCVVCFHLFGRPLILKMMGRSENCNGSIMDWITVRLNATVHLDPRPEFQRGTVYQQSDGIWTWEANGFQRSSRVESIARANCLVYLPPATNEVKDLPKGSRVKAILLPAD